MIFDDIKKKVDDTLNNEKVKDANKKISEGFKELGDVAKNSNTGKKISSDFKDLKEKIKDNLK